MIIETYRAAVDGIDVGERMVRKDAVGDDYTWIEQSTTNRSYNVAMGGCSADDLPEFVRIAADNMRGQIFGFVRWP